MDLREKKKDEARNKSREQEQRDREKTKQETEEIKKMVEEIGDGVLLNTESSRTTMRYMLQRRHSEYMYQGFVMSLQLDEFNRDCGIYKSQGGNGTAKNWHDVNELPIDDMKHPKNIYLEM